jgi:hypothetical protein
MNLYLVTYDNQTLYFIAPNKDKLLKLICSEACNYDYANLIKRLQIFRVAGKNVLDDFVFFKDFISGS